jgi:hypothetical protein
MIWNDVSSIKFVVQSPTRFQRSCLVRIDLSTFSAKIDMAYALEIISDESRVELHKMRNIRNKFAHARKLLSFDQEPMTRMFYELRRPDVEGKNYLEVFTMCGTVIDDELEDFLVSMGETDDVERALKRKAAKAN